MHAHRIQIFDGAHDDAVVVPVPHHLHFELFPADNRLFQQHFRGRRHFESVRDDALELLTVVGDAAPGSAERERRPNDGRETNIRLFLQRLFQGMRDIRPGHLETDVLHGLPEQVAVLGHVDGLAGSGDEFYVVFLEHAFPREVERTVEPGLAAHRGQEGVRTFPGDDSLDRRPVHRLDVDRVRHLRVRHDRRRVGIHQDDPIALLPQRLARLRAGVIEFARLADHDGTGAYDQDALYICAFGHGQ